MSGRGTIGRASCREHTVLLESYESVTSLNVERSEEPFVRGEGSRGVTQSGATEIGLLELGGYCVLEANVVLEKLNIVSGEGGRAAAVGEEGQREERAIRKGELDLSISLELLINYGSVDSF